MNNGPIKHFQYSKRKNPSHFNQKRDFSKSKQLENPRFQDVPVSSLYPSCVRLAKGYTLQGSVCISQSGVDWLVGQGPFLGLENTKGTQLLFFPGKFLGEWVETDSAIEV